MLTCFGCSYMTVAGTLTIQYESKNIRSFMPNDDVCVSVRPSFKVGSTYIKKNSDI